MTDDLELVLTRDDNTFDGVFGLLRWPDGFELHVCEEDWKDNARRQSCIPAGRYRLRRTTYHKHRIPTFEVCDVPGRDRVLVHSGNTEEDSEACLLPGLSRDFVSVKVDEDTGERNKRKRAVLSSRTAFGMFMDRMEGVDECWIDIRWAVGLPGEPHA